jgi:hypothetical protein
MGWRAWSAAAVLGVAAGCTHPYEMGRAPVLPPGYNAESHPPPPTPTGESDDDTALENWKSSVLDRADGDMLGLIRSDIEARIKRLQESDAKLSYLPPGIALEERTRIARRIAFEKKRLAMVDER